jgi:hypothetical protein
MFIPIGCARKRAVCRGDDDRREVVFVESEKLCLMRRRLAEAFVGITPIEKIFNKIN